PVIGMFVNTLALKNQPREEKKFTRYLAEVKEKTLNAFENSDYQYEELVDALVLNRDLARNPLFDTFFMYRNLEVAGVEIPGLKLEAYEFERKTSKFDLTLDSYESGENLAFEFEYSTELFQNRTILRFQNYFETLVSSVLETPEITIGAIDIIPAEEKKRILYEFNETAADYPANKSIHRLFEEQAQRTPDNISVDRPATPGANRGALTYRELNRQSHNQAQL
ncbi:MAG: hypothetical protein GY757_13135, partial [bacterium]|nr:hypothetical protein [bacterium]